MSKILSPPFIDLKRYPPAKESGRSETLKAWDSADEIILQHLGSLELAGKNLLVINDQFGALSTALESFGASTYTDSYMSSQAILLNSQNRIKAVSLLEELRHPEAGTKYDYVLIRIPKNMSFFEDLLCHLSAHLHSGSKVICGAMLKHLPKSSFDLLNKYIGATSTSLAQKKARLIFADFQRAEVSSPYPIQVVLDGFKIPFVNHSNLFSREKLDIGTRFLLEHLPKGGYKSILDLGCANGVIGIALKMLHPSAKVLFSDESKLAIQSARVNYENHFSAGSSPLSGDAQFHWTNCCENLEARSVDLVVCNPPFHQGTTLSDQIAWQMFKDSYRALSPGGLIRVIGNSHLGYHVMLKKIFGNSRIVAKNAKFMIVDAQAQSPPKYRGTAVGTTFESDPPLLGCKKCCDALKLFFRELSLKISINR